MAVTIRKQDHTIGELLQGFHYDEDLGKGMNGLRGRLTIQPEYQRNFVYEGKQEKAVVESVLNKLPLGLVYFVETGSGQLEVLDGQQRITSLGRYKEGRFRVGDYYYDALDSEAQKAFDETELHCYYCTGTEKEIKDWFKTINFQGKPLNEQEVDNAIYSGPFVTSARAELSNPRSCRAEERSTLMTGDVNRQDHLRAALEWIHKDPKEYMSQHRQADDASELVRHTNSVVDWALTRFVADKKTMQGLEWGRLYRLYREAQYDDDKLQTRVAELLSDDTIQRHKGVYEFVLGGEKDKSLLKVRLFSKQEATVAYNRQTQQAKAEGRSNCPDCTGSKIHHFQDMEADHVTAWSKGGETTLENCQMLCKHHNRLKGNA